MDSDDCVLVTKELQGGCKKVIMA